MGDTRNNHCARLAEPCLDCDKYCYPTRAAARSARRSLPGSKKLNVYLCPHIPAASPSEYFHLGHLPKAVVAGLIGREDITASPSWAVSAAASETAA